MKLPFRSLLTLALTLPASLALAAEAPITLHLTPERTLIDRHGAREVILEVELAARRPRENVHSPMNVSVVLDRSGSMEGAKIEKARQAACLALDRLEPDDYFSMIIFDNRAEVLIPTERVGSREHREALKERIDRIRPGGGTALYAGVQLGAEQVRRFIGQERVNRIILLSDGLANVGPQSPKALAGLGRDLGGEGMSVTTIGLGDDFNEDLMTALAEASHAHYYYVQDVEKLPAIMGEELDSSGVRVASGLRLRIELPRGARLREVLGHPEIKCEEHAAEIILPEVFGAEQHLYHLRCVLGEGIDEKAPLAQADLHYLDTEARTEQTRQESLAIAFTDDAGISEQSVNDAAAQRIAVERNRLDKEAAVRLADAGQAREAAALLEQRIQGNKAAPASRQLPGVTAENAKLQQWADELNTRGHLGNTSRKAVQWDNYQDKNQRR